jgi:hypothetical protein
LKVNASAKVCLTSTQAASWATEEFTFLYVFWDSSFGVTIGAFGFGALFSVLTGLIILFFTFIL